MPETNPNARLEAFCDGVFAIAMTLLIIDIKIPSSVIINDSAEFWHALQNMAPSISAFVLSFVVILICWVNHHATLKLVNGSSPLFVYANGLLLFSVVIVPFPTALIGDHLFTTHAAPAVMLYTAVMALQSVAWVAIARAALKNTLTTGEAATARMRINARQGVYSTVANVLLGVVAYWFPLSVAICIAIMWMWWLGYGLRIKHA